MRLSSCLAPLAIIAALTACSSSDAPAAQKTAEQAEPAVAAGAPVAAPAAGGAPSFDCAKADGEATTLVCGDAELAAMDRELARLFALAGKGPNMSADRAAELKTMQRGWVKGRDDCWKADDKRLCVMTAYAMRIHELRQGYANARGEDGKGASMGPVAIACEGTDFGVGATFIQTDPGAVYLQWLENGIALAHVPSGSGAKYEGDLYGKQATLFTQGDEAMLTLPGEAERKCRIEEIG